MMGAMFTNVYSENEHVGTADVDAGRDRGRSEVVFEVIVKLKIPRPRSIPYRAETKPLPVIYIDGDHGLLPLPAHHRQPPP